MKNKRSLGMIKGLSLIEVLVTVVITSIGLMGLVSLQMQAVRATTDSGNRSQAVWLFNDIISRIHANEVSSTSYITPASFLVDIANGQPRPPVCNLAAPPACSRYHTGSLLVPAINCTAAQQATWDLYEVACGAPKDAGFSGNSVSYLPQAQLTIACTTAGCANGEPLTVTLQWRAKTSNEDTTGVAKTLTSGLLTLTDVINP
jgi:type IV pilus assembly protein PilV